ncbi:uncharacterized protein LOC134179384 isoform X3 [Corticium candelabrum]|uniref:uncharacterized protein LOC134179384 isoform X3 n=1 Tax=Corticium candelabrum TaxID=121492 RepID=UPI002E25F88A|nr:uncharacterized protein LOC134179384 isoform X3 [Corticium candelabrum]
MSRSRELSRQTAVSVRDELDAVSAIAEMPQIVIEAVPSRHSQATRNSTAAAGDVGDFTSILTDERSTATAITPGNGNEERDRPKDGLFSNPETKQYIEKHRLNKVISSLTQTLLKQPQLPYNPYRRFINWIRSHSERFVIRSLRGMSIESAINAEVTDTTEWLTCSAKSKDVWALESVLQCVSPSSVLKYKWILDFNQKQAQKTLQRLPHFDGRIVSALVGPCVFAGSIIPHPSPVIIRLEYLIWGQDNYKAIDLFANSVVKDITETVQSKLMIAVELKIKGYTTRHWSSINILQYETELIDTVKRETLDQQTVMLECLFPLSEYSAVDQLGMKQYILTYTELSDERPAQLHCYTKIPLSTLYSGIFFSKQHAYGYLSVFLPASVGLMNERDGRNNQFLAVSNRHLSNTTPTVGTSTPGDVRTRRITARPSRQKVNLPLGVEKVDHMSPDDPKVIVKLREQWKRSIAGCNFPDRIFDIALNILSLATVDRNQFVPETLPQICNMFYSSAAHLSYIVRFGRVLYQVLSNSNELSHLDRLMNSVIVFRDQILDFLNPAAPYIRTDYQSWVTHGLLGDRRSQYTLGGHIIAYDFIRANFDQTLGHKLMTASPTERIRKVANCIFKSILYVHVIQLSLIEDIVVHCDVIRSIQFEISQEYPTIVFQRPRTPLTNTDKKLEKKGFFGGKTVTTVAISDCQTYHHGAEDKLMLSRDQLLLDVELAVKRSTAPPRIGRESVLLQYCVDVRLDDTLHGLLFDLLSDSHLPPNPFPKLANCLTQPLLKKLTTIRVGCDWTARGMQLWHEAHSKICSHLICKSIREDAKGQEYFIYHVPECSAYGHYSSLAMISAQHYKVVAKIALPFFSAKTIAMIGNFKMTVDTAISGFTHLYGRMSPYLLNVDLREHIYVEGPKFSEDEVLTLFAKTILDDVNELQFKKHQLVTGLVIGSTEVDVFSIIDSNKRENYRDEIIDVGRRQQSLFMKAYHVMDWRYVLVVKHYCLHYLTDSHTEYVSFFPENPVALYQNVWTLQEKAIRHFVYSLGSDADDPFALVTTTDTLKYIDHQLSQCIDKMDLLDAYRWILTRALALKHMDAGEIPEVWRLLHGVAGQLEYLHVLSTAMQELVQYELKCLVATGTNDGMLQGVVHVDGVITGRMIDAYRQKLETVLSSSSCHMGTRTLINQMQDRLKVVMTRDATTCATELVISPQAVSVLNDVDVSLQPIMVTSAAEIHAMCTNSQQIFQSVQREAISRGSRRSVNQSYT